MGLRTRWRKLWDRGRAAQPSPDHQRVAMLALQDAGWFLEGTGELVPGFRIDPEDTVVDVGCGQGRASLFAARRGAEVIGVDVDANLFQTLGKKLAASPARSFQLLRGEAGRVPLPDGVASKTICMEVLEHVDDPAKIVAELARITRPGGRILLSVPDPLAESVQRHVAPDAYWRAPNHLRVFERDAFESLVTAAGLTVESRLEGSFFHALFWILFWADAPDGGRPVAKHWTDTWQALLDAPHGTAVRRALDGLMPKNQALVVRRMA